MPGEGEEGESGCVQQPTGGPEVAAVAESTTISGELHIEVDILALNAARKITETIASRVATLKPGIVLIGGEGVAAAARAFVTFRERVNQLVKSLDTLPVDAKPAANKELKKQDGTESVAFGAAFGLVKGVASLMSYFKAETTYHGRKVELTEAALYTLMASQLINKSIPVVLPELFAQRFEKPAATYSVFRLLDELIDRRNSLTELHQGEPPPRVAALLVMAEAIIDSTVKPDPTTGAVTVNQLILGSDVCRLVDGAENPLLVSLKSISAGGNVRTRKHLFTTIFTGDKLSFSGGAAVGYFVVDLVTSRVIGSDVVTAIETMKGS